MRNPPPVMPPGILESICQRLNSPEQAVHKPLFTEVGDLQPAGETATVKIAAGGVPILDDDTEQAITDQNGKCPGGRCGKD